MPGVVIFATGSPIIVDIEESLARSGMTIVGGVRNRPVQSFLTEAEREIEPNSLTAELLKLPFIVPLFTPAHRLEAVNEARTYGFFAALSLIDPTAVLPRVIVHEPGLYIGAGVTLGAKSEFGQFTFVNRGAVIGHHFRSGPFVSIGPGAVIAGQVQIGEGSLIGAGAVLAPQIKVGANAVISAGAVVIRDVPDDTVVMGNPARVVRSKMRGDGQEPAA